ncbi:DUF6545 domain-containing protein [Pseudonocardia parietis]|uniref:DUF6545 domain-containing protein n=1 Tax=Pseudonocardia parietis TaxID=570936 RepID=A0ABS4W598_9PSEU|nr:DUF6545 domain-containing protein [Pseudonocardia parietis]MBP2371335.1 hypothetical protein [Pseudonocardia parietis]
MILWAEAVASVVLVALTAWQWHQVRRHRHDSALKALAVGVTTLAFIMTMSVADFPLTAPIHDVLRAISFTNIAWTLLFYCFSIFFLLAQVENERHEPRRIRRQAAAEFVLYMGFLIPGLLALYTADPDFFGRDRDPDSYLTARNIIYYIGTAFYPILAWSIGATRAIGYLRMLAHTWARFAAIGVIIAMGIMAFGVNGVSLVRQGLYIAYPGSKWPVMSDLYNTGRIGGQILLVLALVSIPLVSLTARFRERRELDHKNRYAQKLQPLWKTLVAEFPDVALPSRRSAESLDPELGRVMIEVSDGLAYLAEWALPAEDESTASHVATALGAKREAAATPWAASIEPSMADEPELPQWEPDFPASEWKLRAQWMLQLQDELLHRDLLAEQPVSGLK